MTIEQNEKYTVITPKSNQAFDALFDNFNTDFDDNQNYILDFSKFEISLENILRFLKISEQQLENGMSFVVIKPDINLDDIPDEIIIVPTFQEAIDVVELDEMTRDLDLNF
jgi:hypothetical protein